MTDDLFNAPADDQPAQPDPNVNYLEQLVGEGKKFKSPEDLARGKFESDNYVKILERRLDDMRNDYLRLDSDYKAGAKLQELISQLENRQTQTSSTTTQSERSENEPPMFDPNKVSEITRAEIQRYETERKQQENYNTLESKLKERFGDNYKTVFRSKLTEAGISEDLAKSLAVNHPNVLLKAIGADTPATTEGFQAPPSSQGFQPNTPPKRTWSYYQKMRREQPELYNQPKIAVQMQEDYAALGKEFEDGDFNH